MPTEPYSAPLSGYTGRFLDSNLVRDYQTPMRTFRARGVFAVPENDRIYMILGQGVAAYTMSTFSSRVTGEMTSLEVAREGPSEHYLPYDAYEYAESAGSGWFVPKADGQDRLYDLDFDDRRNIYVAYSTFGWGIVRDTGSDLLLQSQVTLGTISTNTKTSVIPTVIFAFSAVGRYYAAIASSSAKSVIWDVTDPLNPSLHREVAIGFSTSGSKAKVRTPTGDVLAIIDSARAVRLYKAADFIAGAAPSQTISGPFASVTSDGTRFYAITNVGAVVTIPASVVNDATPYQATSVSTGDGLTVFGASLGAGYLTTTAVRRSHSTH